MIGPVANAELKKLELFTKWFKVYDILRHFVPLTMQANSRLESLDVFRGLTVAAMIIGKQPRHMGTHLFTLSMPHGMAAPLRISSFPFFYLLLGCLFILPIRLKPMMV
jgi:hypothetical protein